MSEFSLLGEVMLGYGLWVYLLDSDVSDDGDVFTG